MQITDPTKSYGTCVLKSGSSTGTILYVSSSPINPITLQSITGSSSNSFNYLEDAVMKAYEIGAPFLSATITIVIKDVGPHFMKRGRGIYKPMNQDFNAQSTSLVIDSFDSATKVTVYYKLRDKWTFKVGAGLTVKNVIFDGIDSSMHYNHLSPLYSSAQSCLSISSICCALNAAGNGI